MKDFDKKLSTYLLLAVASLFYFPLGRHALWDSDEGRYAEIAREMLELKSWIVPHLNYVLYFEKPPLMYWLTAVSLAVFGPNPFAARFWCATFGLLTVWVTMKIAREWRNERTALLAGSLLATSVGFFALTQFLVLDMALTFWMTLAMYAAARLLRARLPDEIRRATFLFATAMAGGILTKGPVALLLPVVVVGLTSRYARTNHQHRRIPWVAAVVVGFLIAAPWFMAVSLAHPFFVPFFFIHEHLARYLTTVHHRTAPFYFFIPVLLVGLLPWSVFLPKAFATWFSHRGEPMKRDSTAALLMIWILFVVLFFSLSQSKLVGYILPVFPAVALFIADEFDDACHHELMPRWVGAGLALLIVVYAMALVILKWPTPLSFLSDPAAQAFFSQSGMLPLVLGFGIFIFVGVWGMRQTLACFGGVLLVQVLLLTTLASLTVQLDPYLSTYSLAETINERADPQAKILAYGVSYENNLQTLPFYTRRRVAVFGPAGELMLGRNHALDAAGWFVAEEAAQDALLREPPGFWGITDEEHWNALKNTSAGASFEKIDQQGHLLLFQKNP